MLPTDPHAIVVTGVAGSGKTTVARLLAAHTGHAFLDADDFHGADARARMAAGTPLTDAHRGPWVASLANALRDEARQGRSTVLAFSGLRAAHRQVLRDSGVPIRFVHLHAPSAVIAERLEARTGHFMPPALLASQLADLQDPAGEPDVVVVDATGDALQVAQRAHAALQRC